MVDEVKSHAKEFVVTDTAAGLAQIPLLAITANDHLAAQTDALVAAIKAKGGTRVTCGASGTPIIATRISALPWRAS